MADKSIPPFTRAVVAVNGGTQDERLVRLVVELARQHHSEVFAVHVVEVDWTLPYVLKNAPCAVWVAREPMPQELRR